jgi:hypothetical protein
LKNKVRLYIHYPTKEFTFFKCLETALQYMIYQMKTHPNIYLEKNSYDRFDTLELDEENQLLTFRGNKVYTNIDDIEILKFHIKEHNKFIEKQLKFKRFVEAL